MSSFFSSRDLHKQQQEQQKDSQQTAQAPTLSPAHPDAPPIPIDIPARLLPQQPTTTPSPQQDQPQQQQGQQKALSPFEQSSRANGTINPFGRPGAGPRNHPTRSPAQQSANTPLPSNPYDQTGPPGLSTNFVDVDCTCVKHIRQSKCDLPFQSFASCHNAVLQSTMKRNLPPMFFQCEGHYARMMMCIENAGLKAKLVEDPKTDTVFVRP